MMPLTKGSFRTFGPVILIAAVSAMARLASAQEATGAIDLTIVDAVERALTQNRDIAVERLNGRRPNPRRDHCA